MEIPNFGEQISKEMELNEEERKEFLKIQHSILGQKVESSIKQPPTTMLCEWPLLEKAYEEYERLVLSASGRVKKATEEYFIRLLKFMGERKEP